MNISRVLIAGALALSMSIARALPSVQDVQAQVSAGRYVEAEQSMAEVVAAKPGSAKAHYLYAEVLAHNGRFELAAQQTKLARESDPKIGFTDPAKFRAFEHWVQQAVQAGPAKSVTPAAVAPAAAPAVATKAATDSGWHVPGWAWVVGAAALAWLAWRAVARTFAASSNRLQPGLQPAGMSAGQPMPYGQGYGPAHGPGYGASPGSTALKTGLAVAGGVAAGMVIDRMMTGGGHDTSSSHADGGSSGLTGGAQPGFFDDQRIAADELQHRAIDYGNDGGWDGGGDASSSDGGGDW